MRVRQGRAERYLVGGGGFEFKNFDLLPLEGPLKKKISGKCGGFFPENKTPQNFFQWSVKNCTFPDLFADLNFSENSLIFNTFRNSNIPGAPLGRWALFLDFSLRCYSPTDPPVVSPL
jgi:hypothetical protein